MRQRLHSDPELGEARSPLSADKFLFWHSALADDGLQRAEANDLVIGHRDGRRPVGRAPLHEDMAPSLSNALEPLRLKDPANFLP